jgi:hypothetical protein
VHPEGKKPYKELWGSSPRWSLVIDPTFNIQKLTAGRKAENPLIFLCVLHRLSPNGEQGLVETFFLVQRENMSGPAQGLSHPKDEIINGNYLQDLGIFAFYDRTTTEKKLNLSTSLVYRPKRAVDVQNAQAMAETLVKAEQEMIKIRDTEGYCDDFPSFIFRVARIFGAEAVIASDDDLGLGPTNFLPMTPDALDDQIRRWKAQ